MSAELVNHVLNSTLPATIKLISVVLAERADKVGGGIYYGVATIAAKASANRRTAQRVLRIMETMKPPIVWVEKEATETEPRHYRLNVAAIKALRRTTKLQRDRGEGGGVRPPGRQSAPQYKGLTTNPSLLTTRSLPRGIPGKVIPIIKQGVEHPKDEQPVEAKVAKAWTRVTPEPPKSSGPTPKPKGEREKWAGMKAQGPLAW